MKTIDPDLFDKIMSLQDSERLDLFEFLGASQADEKTMETLIEEIESSIKKNRESRFLKSN
ncbi:MAG TPA: hypothetical protein ENJ91_03910 [Rhodobacteraceae bacterium]|nr:hypothetical protein [Paracoccaceae bacterium]